MGNFDFQKNNDGKIQLSTEMVMLFSSCDENPFGKRQLKIAKKKSKWSNPTRRLGLSAL